MNRKIVSLVVLLLLFTSFLLVALPQEKKKETKSNEYLLFDLNTARVLEKGKFYFSLFYNNFDREKTDFDCNTVNISFGYGISDRLQLIGTFTPWTQVDFDMPISSPVGPNSHPLWQNTIEEGVGDLTVGAIYNLIAEKEGKPALSLGGLVKIPIANEEKGLGSGAVDFEAAVYLTKELNEMVDLSGKVGFAYIGTPSAISDLGLGKLSHELRYAVGVKLPTKKSLRAIAELAGVYYLNDSDFPQEAPLDLTVGIEYKLSSGLRFALGVRRNLTFETQIGEHYTRPDGGIFMISYIPERKAPPPPPPKPVIPPAPVKPVNHPPKVKVNAIPAQVEEGDVSMVTALASDPDNDPLTYHWSATGGKIEGEGKKVKWIAPLPGVGEYKVTCRVEDGKGGTGEDSATIKVIAKKFGFVDVYFEFDKYELTEAAKNALDKAAEILKKYPALKVEIEGHCCYIGTEEYNMALGEHRAQAIKKYLVEVKGISSNRITTVSYGETRPAFDNSKEETRRFNRRGHFRVVIY